jgi:hypothetical protein
VNISVGEKTYRLPYSFSRFIEVELIVEGDHYPDFYLVSNDLKRRYSSGQWFDFVGNRVGIKIRPGNYTAYALSDFVDLDDPVNYPETDEYILAKTVEIKLEDSRDIIFDLSEAKKYKIKSENLAGKKLFLNQWQRGLAVYKGKFRECERFSYTNQTICEENSEGYFCLWEEEYSSCQDRRIGRNYFDSGDGNKEVYLSTRPDNGLDIDYIFKYIGTRSDD